MLGIEDYGKGRPRETYIEVEMRANVNISETVLRHVESLRQDCMELFKLTHDDYNRLFRLEGPVHILDFYHLFGRSREAERLRYVFSTSKGERYFVETKKPSSYDPNHLTEENRQLSSDQFFDIIRDANINLIVAGSRRSLKIPKPDIDLDFDRVYGLDPNKLRASEMTPHELEKLRENLVHNNLDDILECDLGEWTEFEATYTITEDIDDERAKREARYFTQRTGSEIRDFASLFGVYTLEEAPKDEDDDNVLGTDVRGILVLNTYPEIIYDERVKRLGLFGQADTHKFPRN